MEPWRARLETGDAEAAWTLFLARYHRLIGATIARVLGMSEDARDAFADVCDRLSENNLARLRRFHETPGHRAKFSTWLVVVVRNLAIDWRRARDGRPRATAPPGLSPLRERIYQLVLVERRPHVEAYEVMCSAEACSVSFGEFLREVAATHRAVDARRWSHLALLHGGIHDTGDRILSPGDPVERSEEQARLGHALAQLSDEDRAALDLFVVEGRPAEEVARAIGWPSAKTVYNRVQRALTTLRSLMVAESSRPRHPRR
ncbi:MAG TPA: sigma-70 family RNA polymerase sigma factor [Gemmatimonadaceae bacterium]|nr:sigma-70 family RNA polymerase sigma factor [Gemmatimonadaceae bacterium]